MSRTPLRLCVTATVMLTAAFAPLRDVRADDKARRAEIPLIVQATLREGRDLTQRGEYARAVEVLEKQLGLINGNREYLMALRDAYAGLIPQLQNSNRLDEMKTYQTRLTILEPVARAPSMPRDTTARGSRPEPGISPEAGDPFHPSNAAAPKKSSALREQAEQAFEKKQYESAAGLFERANRQSPETVAGCREEWGYCKLYAVAQTINRAGALQADELRREIRDAVGMAPKLKGWGDTLLERLTQPAAPAVSVKHTPRVGNGWAKAETTNFRIFHATDEEAAEKIARVAEATRVNMTRKWFGEEATDWSPRCDVYVHPSGQGYAKATGAPATAPGHSTIKQENGRVLERRIDLRGDDPNLLVGVLPHEATHVVLAGRFGQHYVPRWADEGMAVLSEPRERINLHLRNLPKHQTEGTLFGVAELIRLNDYPEARRVGPFYAQSVSLVDFLCKKKDAATFATFLREALDSGYESSLRRHFGYASAADLDRDWKQYAFGEGAVASASDKR
jgi:tetratricopeptide (TPR) repeat protein